MILYKHVGSRMFLENRCPRIGNRGLLGPQTLHIESNVFYGNSEYTREIALNSIK